MFFKRIIVFVFISFLVLAGCAREADVQDGSASENNILRTYTASEQDGRLMTYYELEDGTWKTEEYSYQFKLALTGRMHNAVLDTTFICLSNSEDISFSRIADSFFSSNAEDFPDKEEVVIVEIIY